MRGWRCIGREDKKHLSPSKYWK